MIEMLVFAVGVVVYSAIALYALRSGGVARFDLRSDASAFSREATSHGERLDELEARLDEFERVFGSSLGITVER